jgi:undecaprenyl-diphosphatase
MIDFFYNIDVGIFYFINQTISVKFLDKFFLIITDVKHWYIAYLVLLGICFTKGGRIGKIAVLGAIILITISDQLNSNFLKHLFERIRPCHVLEDVRMLVSCKSSYSFPSSHAFNNFALSFYFMTIFPKYKWLLIIAASLVALSRPYIGVHYPSDILVGAVLGGALGYAAAVTTQKIDNYIELRKDK